MSDVEQLSDEQFAVEMVKFFGLKRAAAIFGYCLLWMLQGKTRADVELEPKAGASWYILSDLRKFRRHLISLGKWPEEYAQVDGEQLVKLYADRAGGLARVA